MMGKVSFDLMSIERQENVSAGTVQFVSAGIQPSDLRDSEMLQTSVESLLLVFACLN
jgi:hypothetical protein